MSLHPNKYYIFAISVLLIAASHFYIYPLLDSDKLKTIKDSVDLVNDDRFYTGTFIDVPGFKLNSYEHFINKLARNETVIIYSNSIDLNNSDFKTISYIKKRKPLISRLFNPYGFEYAVYYMSYTNSRLYINIEYHEGKKDLPYQRQNKIYSPTEGLKDQALTTWKNIESVATNL